MKKTKLLCLSMLSAMALTGCSANASFKEVKYEKNLTAAEETIILTQVKENLLAGLASYNTKTVTNIKRDLTENHNETSTEYNLYANNYAHADGKTVTESKTDGLVRKQEIKTTSDFFRLNDDYVATYRTNDDTITCNIQAGNGDTVYENALNGVTTLFNNLTGVKDSKGNVKFIASDVEEDYQPVLYGNETKVVHTLTKSQKVLEIDKNNKIKSYYAYSSTETNQDPDTGEIKKKDVKTNETKTTATFTYSKNRKDKGNKYASIKDTILNTYVFTDGPALKAKYNGEDIAIGSNVSQKRLGYSKYEYVAEVAFNVGTAPINENGKEFNFYLTGKINKFGSEDPGQDYNIPVTSVSFPAKYDFAKKQQITMIVKYTVELTGVVDGGAKVTEVSYYFA